MPDRTWDVEDPRDLPYRFAFSPITGEIYVISFGFHGLGVSMVFENRPAFHRFLVEGNKTDDLIQIKILKEASDILRGKQIGEV